MKGYCDNCGKVIDEVEIYKFQGTIVCDECFHKLSKGKFVLKRYLCAICKLNETCQNNFDYECIEASDFLFVRKPKIITYTVKDDFLNKMDENYILGDDRKMCITCGENEAINEFYGECERCIKEAERKEYIDAKFDSYSWSKDYDLGKEAGE